jgi:replicative DNA helicase
MSPEQLVEKMICFVGKVQSKKLRQFTNNISDDEFDRLSDTSRKLNEQLSTRISFNSRRRTFIEDIEVDIHRIKQEYGRCDFVMIDYIGLLEVKDKTQKDLYHKMSYISATLKRIARQEKVLVIALCQLNRLAGKEKRKPENTDLRDSGAIEQDADTIMFVHRDEYYGKEKVLGQPQDDNTYLCLRKNRHGHIGRYDIPFTYYPPTGEMIQMIEDK